MKSEKGRSRKKWYLSIINYGLNGQTSNFLRLVRRLKSQERLSGFDEGPGEGGYLRWVKTLREKAGQGLAIQIHVPGAAWMLPFVPFFHRFPNVEFFLEGHLIEPEPDTWSHVWKFPLFFLPRLLLNRTFWVSVLVFLGICPRVMVASFHQQAELIDIGYPCGRISRLPTCPPEEHAGHECPGRPTSPSVLGYIGHGTPVKGLEIFSESLKSLEIRALPWRLKVAIGLEGRGRIQALLQTLKETHGDRVEILDRVDSWTFLKNIDLLVLPYIVDFGTMVYPVTLVDAMHAGAIPLIADFPVLCEPLAGMKAPLFFPAGDVKQLEKTISRWVLMEAGQRQAWAQVLMKRARRLWGTAWEKRLERLFA